uniref:Uncharacterized protein MANES_16G110100 n=2 Tax=Rhizophora mucronata TaxID=61149 RepID=A0A2P2M9S0_RHIMU
MDSWLKAAEGILEVVDRKAKQVAGEKPDEYSDSPAPASNGKGSHPKGRKPRKKVQTSTQMAKLEASSDKDEFAASVENDGNHSRKSFGQLSGQQQQNADKDLSSTASLETPANEIAKHDADHIEVPLNVGDSDPERVTKNVEAPNENASDASVDHPSLVLPTKEIESMNEENGGENDKLKDADALIEVDQGRSELSNNGSPTSTETALEDGDHGAESLVDQKKPQENKADNSSMKLQDQLEEAQGLLKTAISTGQSKEARLARVCTGLHTRIQEYKYENTQLEELLSAEREITKSYEARIKQLQQDLSISKSEVTRVESNMAAALATKNSEIEALVSSMEALKKQAAVSEGNLASLQANMESMMRSRELTETRMIQALREELASAERRVEEEHALHNSSKLAAMERQAELEHRAVEASTALARAQRIADERTTKATELEQKLALLEVEYASLNQELQDMEARARRGQKKSSEEANQVIQMQAWQEEVERSRQGQRNAESKLSSVEAEVHKIRVEMAAMKRDAEHYSCQEHMELEKRYRELTDLLYYKQTQLEAMASEKAAAEFQLEKELNRLQEAQVDAERSRVSRRPSSTWEEDTEIRALDCKRQQSYWIQGLPEPQGFFGDIQQLDLSCSSIWFLYIFS